MNRIARTFFALIACATLAPAIAHAQLAEDCQDPLHFDRPTKFEANGHYYQAIEAQRIPWWDANAAAELMRFTDPVTGIEYPGHLVIITTPGEDCFVEKLRHQAFVDNEGKPEYWAGGIQDTPNDGPAANWEWIIPEAPFDNYVNWQSGEPNDFPGGTREERYLGLGHTDTFGWNDEASLGNIGGYVVEFDVDTIVFDEPEDVEKCFDDSMDPGCQIGPQLFILPASSRMSETPQISATIYRLSDVQGRCDRGETLSLFGGELIISPHHCATAATNHEFIVIRTESEGIELREGTVRVIQDARSAFAGPGYPNIDDFPDCDDPIPAGTAPENQEVVIYQRDLIGEMKESGETWGLYTDTSGATGDITDSCGTSRARRAQNSWSVVGMVQSPQPGSRFEDNQDLNRQWWTDLVSFKFRLLLESIADSEDFLSRRDFSQIRKQAEQAEFKFNQASYQRAITHLNNLERKVLRATYNYDPMAPVPNNFQGEALERLGSIRFIIDTKIRGVFGGN